MRIEVKKILAEIRLNMNDKINSIDPTDEEYFAILTELAKHCINEISYFTERL